MSRIGKKPIVVPKGVTVKINEDALDIQGPKGKLTQRIPPGVAFDLADGQLRAKTVREDPQFAPVKGQVVRSMTRGTTNPTVWVGTSGGVFLCRPAQACTLAVPNVDARFVRIAIDDKFTEIWCGTRDNGLLRIRDDPSVGIVVAQLDSEQGLPSQSVFSVLPLRTGGDNETLLIGTNRGIVRYLPGNVPPSLSVTRLVSKRVHALSELPAGVNLEYPQNSLLLDVTAISSRTYPEQFQYAFTLEDSAGKQVKQKLSRDSQFTMEGLKPDKYKVTAIAFSKDLMPSQSLTFSFTVARASKRTRPTATSAPSTTSCTPSSWPACSAARSAASSIRSASRCARSVSA